MGQVSKHLPVLYTQLTFHSGGKVFGLLMIVAQEFTAFTSSATELLFVHKLIANFANVVGR